MLQNIRDMLRTFAADDGSETLASIDTPARHCSYIQPLCHVHEPPIGSTQQYLHAYNAPFLTHTAVSFVQDYPGKPVPER